MVLTDVVETNHGGSATEDFCSLPLNTLIHSELF